MLQMSIEYLRTELDDLDSRCFHVHHGITLKLHSGILNSLGILFIVSFLNALVH